jgi:hypothetical protein
LGMKAGFHLCGDMAEGRQCDGLPWHASILSLEVMMLR